MVKRYRWLLAVAWFAATLASRTIAGRRRGQGRSGAGRGQELCRRAAPQQNLTTSEQRLASEFKDLEGVLMRMRDLVRPTDPNRAALIEKALKESGDRRVEADFQEIVDLLRQEQLGNAARKQGKVNEDLEAILQLLMSEDYAKRIKERQAEYRKYLQQLNILIRDQGDLLGRNLSGDDPKPLSLEQHGLADRTGSLSQGIQQLQQKDRGDAKGDSNKGDSNKGDSNKGDSNKVSRIRVTPARATASRKAVRPSRSQAMAKNPTSQGTSRPVSPARRIPSRARTARSPAARTTRGNPKITSPVKASPKTASPAKTGSRSRASPSRPRAKARASRRKASKARHNQAKARTKTKTRTPTSPSSRRRTPAPS